jgi:hypothetical protein
MSANAYIYPLSAEAGFFGYGVEQVRYESERLPAISYSSRGV